MIGQDFKTGKYLGYRALLNRGFSREHPPQDLDLEREKVVQEFIELWTKGLAEAGVSPQKIYSHTAFLSRRAFKLGDNKETTYSQHNHFAPPSVAFGKHHRPGFSTYPQPGLFDDIYEELAKHKQVGWASCEGTNLQLGSGPGQSGMTMETYLAKMFNHGATLVNIFSWGIGGEANKNMDFRVVTEGEEALRAYRKFLKGEPLIEAKTEALTLLERLPPKIHKIQKELPAWIQKTGNKDKAAALMQKLEEHLKAKNFEEVEKTADSILKMMGVNAEPPGRRPSKRCGKRLTGKGRARQGGRAKMGGQRARPIGHPQDDAGEGQAADRRRQGHRSGSGTGSRARTARPADYRSPGQGAPSHNGAVPSGFGLVHRGQSERRPARPRLGFADRRAEAQVQPPPGAHAEGADHRPGARRAPIAGRTAHATDEYPAIRGSQPHARPDARDRGAPGRLARGRSQGRPGPRAQCHDAAGSRRRRRWGGGLHRLGRGRDQAGSMGLERSTRRTRGRSERRD